jgi:hypothetical protein
VTTYKYGSWLVLLIADAGESGAARVRGWRALKALGCGVLRDGVYLLPDRDDLRGRLVEQRDEVVRAGGRAVLFASSGIGSDDAALRALFDRSGEYAALTTRASALAAAIRTQPDNRLRRSLRALDRDCALLDEIDYFRTPARSGAVAAIAAAKAAFAARA